MFPFQICIFKQRPRWNINTRLCVFFLLHAHKCKVGMHNYLFPLRCDPYYALHQAFAPLCTFLFLKEAQRPVSYGEVGGVVGRRSKGVMMQVLIKRLFPQGRRVEDCEFNKREKKKVCQHQKNFFLNFSVYT